LRSEICLVRSGDVLGGDSAFHIVNIHE